MDVHGLDGPMGKDRVAQRAPVRLRRMSAIGVRRAGSEDAAAIARVHVRSWQVGYRGLVPDAVLDGLSVGEREGTWRNLHSGSDGASFTLVAERKGDVVGFCSLVAPSRDDDAGESTCELTAMYVEPDVWRGGVASALLTEALGKVREDGWAQITLWVFAANDGGRALYDRFGLAPDGAELRHERSGQTEVRLRASLTA